MHREQLSEGVNVLAWGCWVTCLGGQCPGSSRQGSSINSVRQALSVVTYPMYKGATGLPYYSNIT